MGIRLTVLVATALLASPAIASAGQIEDAQKVALLYWQDRGHSECEGVPIDFTWHPEGALGEDVLGTAQTGRCVFASECLSGTRECHETAGRAEVNLSEALLSRAWSTRCRIVVHEFGHLVGFGHDPHLPVMSRSATPNECLNPTALRGKAHRFDRRAHRLSRRDHPRRARRFERRARQVSRQADRAAEFRVRAGL